MADEHIRDAPFALEYSEFRAKRTKWVALPGTYDDIHAARDGASLALDQPRRVAIKIVDSTGAMRDMLTCIHRQPHEPKKRKK